MAISVNDENFDQLVINSGKPAMVDFWAEWCGPCKMMLPIVEEISEEYGDKVTIAKVDVDSCQNLAMRFGIRSIPTILFIKDGNVIDKQVGAGPKSTLVNKIEGML